MNLSDQERNQRVASYWSSINNSDSFSKDTYWLANPIVHQHYQLRASGGKGYYNWLDFCIGHFFGTNIPTRILSVGCGSGGLERHLANLKAFEELDAIDIAPISIEIAKQKAKEENISGINYYCRNIEESDFPGENYDAVFYNMSLHHMFNVDAVLEKTKKVMNKDSFLFIHEYIGPNRFDFTDREKEVISAVYTLIPDQFCISLAEANFGFLQKKIVLPTPAEVAQVDPSEAVCSAQITSTLPKYFDIVEFNPIGGTILQFLLQNIAGHFRVENQDSLDVLDLIMQIEDTLIKINDLEPHFALIIAQPK
jgi:2-polyprenyl-3-methyl-5-hydroxy-6-metoxy-1,4-benzoquinol methylase